MINGIYSFRGADISNILNFEKDFPGTKIIKLEQNYRCTGNILKVANMVIKNNEVKYEKKLWTKNEEGCLPQIYCAQDEYDEARFIVEQISHLKREEYYKYADFAVLYRMNTQSRAIEDILRREDIPYRIVGGLKFYERKEIKDIISYLRLIHNPSDNLSLRRIINEPKRGIGKTSLDQIEEIARNTNISMYEIIKNAAEYNLNRIFLKSREFIEIMEELISQKEDLCISELVKATLNKTGYTKALELEDTIEASNRIENLEEFLTVAIEFEEQSADDSIAEFLEGITLSSDIDELEDTDDTVTLMTIHSAKGLEFPVIFLVGLEEGIFPGHQAIGEPKELEEERRLCYVGITRAKNYLHLSFAKQRTIYGSTSCNPISRFIREIPEEFLEGYDQIQNSRDTSIIENQEWKYQSEKTDSTVKAPKTTRLDPDLFKNVGNSSNTAFQYRTAESFLNRVEQKNDIDLSQYKQGIKVYHKKFGEGIITMVEQEGEDLKVDIDFVKAGHKRLMARFAGLEIIG